MQGQLVKPPTERAGGPGVEGSTSLRSTPSTRRREATRLCLALLGAVALASLAILAAGRPGSGAPAVARGRRVEGASRGDGLEALPLAAQGPISDFLGSQEPRFSLHGLAGRNPAQGLGLRFATGGVTLSAGGASVGLGLSSYGRDGRMRAVAPSAPNANGNRVAYRHGPLTETYANGPLGLDQGFELAARPAGRGALTFLTGVSSGASVSRDGNSILIHAGGQTLSYGDLVVTDARGHRLPAGLSVQDGKIAAKVDDANAVYPLHVDPLVRKAFILDPNEADKSIGTGFGFAVAMAPHTIAVGDPYGNEYKGEVFVFEEPAGGWADTDTPAASLVGDETGEGVDGELFGTSIALSGTTIVVGAPSHLNGRYYRGAAYVFRAPAADKWEEATRLARLEAPVASEYEEGLVGERVAVAGEGKSVAVAATGRQSNLGAVFIYGEPAGGWEDTSSDAAMLHGPTANEGLECPQLGDGLALAEHESRLTVAAGAPGIYELGDPECERQLAGHVYVFNSPSGGWTGGGEYEPALTLSSGHGALGDRLGEEVGISTSGEEILAGAPGQTVAGHPGAGAAYLFTRPGSGWTSSPAPATFEAPAPFEEAGFGETVALAADGTRLVVSQPAFGFDDSHHAAGEYQPSRNFVFDRPGSGWASTSTPDEVLEGSGDSEEDAYLTGRTLAIEGETVVEAGGYYGPAEGTVVAIDEPGFAINIESPTEGAEYTPGQPLTATYSCAAPEGTTMKKCEGPVASGQRIDTGTVGDYAFTVNAEDSLGATSSRTVYYRVAYPASPPASEPISKEATQQTRTTAQAKLEEEEVAAIRKQEFKEFIVYLEYMFSHPAPIASLLKNGAETSRSLVPEPAWIATSGNAFSWGLPKASAQAQSEPLATASSVKKKKPIKVFSSVIHFRKAGKEKVVVPLTAAGRKLAERAIAEHHSLKVDWTITVHPAKGPAQTRTFTAVYPPGGSKGKGGGSKG